MPITRVQSNIAANAHATTVTCSWPAPTTNNSFLVMGVSAFGGSGVTFLPPADWVLIETAFLASSVRTSFYYLPNAASRSGTESLTMDIAEYAIMALGEFSGLSSMAGPDAAVGGATGTSLNPITGTTGLTNYASDLVVAMIGVENDVNVPTQSAPTNGFTMAQTLIGGASLAPGYVGLAFLYQVVALTGNYQTGTTCAWSSPYAGIVQAFGPQTALPLTAWEGSQPAQVIRRYRVTPY